MTKPPIQHRDFYVYALFRADGITPFYIGKGRGNRISIHERDAPRFTSHKDRIIQNMLAAGIATIPKCKLIENLSDDEAKVIEIDLIHLIGRWPKGPLANLTRGGDGVGALSPETVRRKRLLGIRNWYSGGTKDKMQAAFAAYWTPDRRAAHGAAKRASMTPEFRLKLSKAMRLAAQREEVKEARRVAQNKPEVLLQKSENMKRDWATPEGRKKRTTATREVHARTEYRKKRSDILIRCWADATVRAKILAARAAFFASTPRPAEQREADNKRLNSPSAIAKRAATNRLPHVKEKRIAAQKAAFATPEAKAKRSAASKSVWARRRAHQYAVPSENDNESQPQYKFPGPS